jgi:hypothetical protein
MKDGGGGTSSDGTIEACCLLALVLRHIHSSESCIVFSFLLVICVLLFYHFLVFELHIVVCIIYKAEAYF